MKWIQLLMFSVALNVAALSPATAEMILGAKLPEQDVRRVDELLRKKSQSALSSEQEALLQDYLHADSILTLLQFRARRTLGRVWRSEWRIVVTIWLLNGLAIDANIATIRTPFLSSYLFAITSSLESISGPTVQKIWRSVAVIGPLLSALGRRGPTWAKLRLHWGGGSG